MIWNYIKLFFRHASRHKLYAIINIAGLALGLACCFLIYLYVQDEMRYDQYHSKLDRIYRINVGRRQSGEIRNANSSYSPGPVFASQFSAIEDFVRLRMIGWNEPRVVRVGEKSFYEESFVLADSSVFNVFTYPLTIGDSAGALDNPNSIVLSESMALKYFGQTNVLGMKIQVDVLNNGNFIPFQVTGVMEDIPFQSHIRADMLASFHTLDDYEGEKWGLDACWNYLLLQENTDIAALESDIDKFILDKLGEDYFGFYSLQNVGDIWFGPNLSGQPDRTGSMQFIFIFGAIAVFVLLLACINFVNLATARSMRRAREVGLRKVLGAQRWQLIRQFLSESIVQAVFALLIAMVIVELFLPVLNNLAEKHLATNYVDDPSLAGVMLILTVVVGVAAGIYPALVLSLFSPSEALKTGGGGIAGRVNLLRRGLIVVQLAVAVVLVVGTVVAVKQMQYIRNKDLGFEKEQIVVLPFNEDIRKQFDTFRQDLLRQPGILGVSGSEQIPGRAGNGAGYELEGVTEEIDGAYRLLVDNNFVATYGLETVAGREFRNDELLEGEMTKYIVNEEFVRYNGLDNPRDILGMQLTFYHMGLKRKGPVVGVVNDFNFFSLKSSIDPMILSVWPSDYFGFLSVRVNPREVNSVMASLTEIWQKYVPGYPFDYYFLDQDYNRLHRRDARFSKLITYFAGLAILVACLGLFGLSSYSAVQRSKEISIRKVLGASRTGVVSMLMKEIVVLVVIANVIAWPVAYYFMSSWLENFVYRIDLHVGLYALAGAIALIVTLAATAHQALRAAGTNPAKALRYE